MFSPGDVVWAKYDSYPYWPSRIAPAHITDALKEYYKRDGIGVLFFGSSLSYGLVDPESVLSFQENYERFAYCIEPDFSVALEMAKINEVCDPELELPKKKRRRSMKKKIDDGVIHREIKSDGRMKRMKFYSPNLGSKAKDDVEKGKEGKTNHKAGIKKDELKDKKTIRKDFVEDMKENVMDGGKNVKGSIKESVEGGVENEKGGEKNDDPIKGCFNENKEDVMSGKELIDENKDKGAQKDAGCSEVEPLRNPENIASTKESVNTAPTTEAKTTLSSTEAVNSVSNKKTGNKLGRGKNGDGTLN